MSSEEVEKKTEEAIAQIDPEELSEVMSAMAAALLMGQQPDMVNCYVRLSIPKPIYDIVNNVSRKFGLNPEEALSQMASEGFSHSIKSITGMAVSVAEEAEEETEPEPVPEAAQPDLSTLMPGLEKVMAGFGQLKGLANELQKMQKVLEDAGLTDTTNDSEPRKNSQ